MWIKRKPPANPTPTYPRQKWLEPWLEGRNATVRTAMACEEIDNGCDNDFIADDDEGPDNIIRDTSGQGAATTNVPKGINRLSCEYSSDYTTPLSSQLNTSINLTVSCLQLRIWNIFKQYLPRALLDQNIGAIMFHLNSWLICACQEIVKLLWY